MLGSVLDGWAAGWLWPYVEVTLGASASGHSEEEPEI